MALKASGMPRHIGKCPCGLPRGHSGLCNGEVPLERVTLPSPATDTEWHYMRDSLIPAYGDELANWLACRIGSAMRGKEYVGNFSICEVGTTGWDRHMKVLDGRCCGTHDETLHHYKSDRQFHYGFDYGH